MNPLEEKITSGTLGELFVQLKLLELDVQAAPPLKDSGNDLIAIKDEIFRAIQVKSSKSKSFNIEVLSKRKYHILALVKFEVENENLKLDKSRIYLVPKDEVPNKSTIQLNQLKDDYILSKERIELLWKK